MTVFLDLIGSWIVRASLIAVMLTLTVNMNNALYQSSEQANARGLVSVVDSVIYADVNAAGYNVSSPVTSNTFNTFNATNLFFYADLPGGVTPDLIKYTTVYDATTKLYKLYRQVNSETNALLGSVYSNVTFKYYNASGVETAVAANIRQVRVMVDARYVLTNAFVKTKGLTVDTLYATSDFKVYPPNLL
jgi:hypothetical protein